MGGGRASGDGTRAVTRPGPCEAPGNADSESQLPGERRVSSQYVTSYDNTVTFRVDWVLTGWTVWARHVSPAPAPRVSVSARAGQWQSGHVRHVTETGVRGGGVTSRAGCEISSGLTETGIIHTTLTRIKVKFAAQFPCSIVRLKCSILSLDIW